MKRVTGIVALVLMLPGCIARTAVDIITLPVKATGQAADWATTSQDESDRNRGREIRKQEERDAKERRRACREAGDGDCD